MFLCCLSYYLKQKLSKGQISSVFWNHSTDLQQYFRKKIRCLLLTIVKIPAYSSLLGLLKTPSFWHISLHKWFKQKALAEQADWASK